MTAAPERRSLTGVRVLDLSRLLPGPYLTMILSDLGADVVKIEGPPLGDYMRSIPPAAGGLGGRFLQVNRDKRSLALNLKTDAGKAALVRMVKAADVVVESFRPGVMDRLGLGWDTLREANPRVILCSLSSFGQTGPYRERAGHDLGFIALAGVLGMSGAAGAEPQIPGVQIGDLAGGALWGAVGILAALVERGRTGAGKHLDISMTEGALALLAPELGNLFTGQAEQGARTLHGEVACYGVYAAKTGHLAVGALEPKFWLAFNELIGRKANAGDLLETPERQATIRAEVQAILLTRTRDEWMQLFDKHDVCVEPVLAMDELEAHPVHAARDVFFEVAHPELGRVKQVRTPLGPPHARSVAPKLGEHTGEVLFEYGFTGEEIDELRATGALG